jgi:hypothetical protein
MTRLTSTPEGCKMSMLEHAAAADGGSYTSSQRVFVAARQLPEGIATGFLALPGPQSAWFCRSGLPGPRVLRVRAS